MILEQEKKKLKFYLNFGALTMVWFVHSLIVYIISLRVEVVWQSKLISGFSSAANFLAFAVITRLLWPSNPRSRLFRKNKHSASDTVNETEADNLSTLNNDDDYEDEYDGLEMRDLTENNNNLEMYNYDSSNNNSTIHNNRNETGQPRILITTTTNSGGT